MLTFVGDGTVKVNSLTYKFGYAALRIYCLQMSNNYNGNLNIVPYSQEPECLQSQQSKSNVSGKDGLITLGVSHFITTYNPWEAVVRVEYVITTSDNIIKEIFIKAKKTVHARRRITQQNIRKLNKFVRRTIWSRKKVETPALIFGDIHDNNRMLLTFNRRCFHSIWLNYSHFDRIFRTIVNGISK